MGTTGFPSLGGAVKGPPSLEGIFRVRIAEIQWSENDAKDDQGTVIGTRQVLTASLFGYEDPEHVSKDGKEIIRLKGMLALDHEDEDKKQTMLGMVKRRFFDGFGVPWPEKAKGFDPRVFLEKTAYVAIGPGNQKRDDGTFWPEVKAVSQDKAALEKAAAKAKAKQAGAGAAVAAESTKKNGATATTARARR